MFLPFLWNFYFLAIFLYLYDWLSSLTPSVTPSLTLRAVTAWSACLPLSLLILGTEWFCTRTSGLPSTAFHYRKFTLRYIEIIFSKNFFLYFINYCYPKSNKCSIYKGDKVLCIISYYSLPYFPPWIIPFQSPILLTTVFLTHCLCIAYYTIH